MTDRQSTHGHDCWGWGPKHYECAVREIKALRAEVGELHMHAKRRDQYAVEKAAQALDWKKRAERLAEALREELRWWADRKADAIREQVGGLTRGDPEAIARCDAAIQRINAALDQARGKGVADEA